MANGKENEFDPNQPFEVVGKEGVTEAKITPEVEEFDPNQPFEQVGAVTTPVKKKENGELDSDGLSFFEELNKLLDKPDTAEPTIIEGEAIEGTDQVIDYDLPEPPATVSTREVDLAPHEGLLFENEDDRKKQELVDDAVSRVVKSNPDRYKTEEGKQELLTEVGNLGATPQNLMFAENTIDKAVEEARFEETEYKSGDEFATPEATEYSRNILREDIDIADFGRVEPDQVPLDPLKKLSEVDKSAIGYMKWLKEFEPGRLEFMNSQKEKGQWSNKEQFNFINQSVIHRAELLNKKAQTILGEVAEPFSPELQDAMGQRRQFTEEESGRVNALTELINERFGEKREYTPEEIQQYNELKTEIDTIRANKGFNEEEREQLWIIGDEMTRLQQDLEAKIKAEPHLVEHLSLGLMDQAEIDREFEAAKKDPLGSTGNLVSYINFMYSNQVMRPVKKFAASVLSLPRTLTPDNQWGKTDQLAEWAEDVFDPDAPGSFFSRKVPTQLQGGLIEKDKLTREQIAAGEQPGYTMQWNKLVPKTTETLTNMMILLSGGAVGGSGKIGSAAGLVSASFALTHNDYWNEAVDAGLSPEQASYFAMSAATITSGLEMVNPQKYVLGDAGKKELIKTMLGKLVKGQGMKSVLKEGAKFATKEIAGENLQEFLQLMGDNISKRVANNVVGEDKFDTSVTREEMFETLVLTSIVSGGPAITTGARGGRQALRENDSELKKQSLFEAANNVEKYLAGLDQLVEENHMTLDQAEVSKREIEDYAKVVRGLPENLTDQQKSDLADLIYQKEQLTADPKDVVIDENVKKRRVDQVKALDVEINRVLDGQKPLTETEGRIKVEKQVPVSEVEMAEDVGFKEITEPVTPTEAVEAVEEVVEAEAVTPTEAVETTEAVEEVTEPESVFEPETTEAAKQRELPTFDSEIETQLTEHSKHHTLEHMASMRKQIAEGKSFEEAHKEAPISKIEDITEKTPDYARKIRKRTEVPSPEKGIDGEKERRLRLRDTEKDRLEAAEREAEPSEGPSPGAPEVEAQKKMADTVKDMSQRFVQLSKIAGITAVKETGKAEARKKVNEAKRDIAALQEEFAQFVKSSEINKLDAKLRKAILRKAGAIRTPGTLQAALDYTQKVITKQKFKEQEIAKQGVKDKIIKALNPKTYLQKGGKVPKAKKKGPSAESIKALGEVYAVIKDPDPAKIEQNKSAIEKKLNRIFEKMQGITNQINNSNLVEGGQAYDELINMLSLYDMVNIDNMNLEELQEANELINAIVTQSKTAAQIKNEAERQRVKEVIKASEDTLSGDKEIPKDLDVRDKAVRDAKKGAWGIRIPKLNIDIPLDFVTLDRFSSLMDKLSRYDKGTDPFKSFLNKHFDGMVRQSRHDNNVMNRAAHAMVQSKLRDIYDIPKDSKGRRKLRTELSKNKEEQELTWIENGVKKTELWTQNQAYKKWQELQNPDLFETFDNMGWSFEKTQAIENFLTPQVKEWAQYQMDKIYPMVYDQVNKVYSAMNGVNLPQQEFYTPIFRHHEGKGEVDVNELYKNFGDPMANLSSDRFKSRINTKSPLRKVDGDEILMNYIDQMNFYTAWAPTITELKAVFKNKDVMNRITILHGKGYNQVIDGFIKDLSRQPVDSRAVNATLDMMRKNLSLSTLALKPVLAIKQLTSIPAMATDIPTRQWVKGFGEFMKSPIQNTKTLLNTEFIQDRLGKGFDRDMMLNMAKDVEQQMSGSVKWRDAVMIFTKYGDAAAIIMGGYPVYKYYLDKNKGNPNAKKIAEAEFAKAATMSQQAGNMEDLNQWQRGGSAARLFTMYMTSPIQYHQQATAALRNIIRGRGTKKENAKKAFMYHIFLPMLWTFAGAGFKWDDEEEEKALLLGNFQSLPIVGEGIQMIQNAVRGERLFEVQGSPIIGAMNSGVRLVEDIVDIAEKDNITMGDYVEAIDDLGKIVGYGTGLPIPGITNSASALINVTEKEDPVRSILGWSDFALGKKGEKKEIWEMDETDIPFWPDDDDAEFLRRKPGRKKTKKRQTRKKRGSR